MRGSGASVAAITDGPAVRNVTVESVMPVSRSIMLAKLNDAYAVYFDVMPVDEETPHLAAGYAFHSVDECFVLSKKVKLWRAEINEFVYVFSVPELSADIFDLCRGKALELGMDRIRPHIEHRSSFITVLFICDSVADEAARLVRRTRHHKDFLFSLHGWMDFRTAALDLSTGTVTVNAAGRELADFIRGNLAKCQLI